MRNSEKSIEIPIMNDDSANDVADDDFCEALYNDYQASPDKGTVLCIEDAARMLGMSCKFVNCIFATKAMPKE